VIEVALHGVSITSATDTLLQSRCGVNDPSVDLRFHARHIGRNKDDLSTPFEAAYLLAVGLNLLEDFTFNFDVVEIRGTGHGVLSSSGGPSLRRAPAHSEGFFSTARICHRAAPARATNRCGWDGTPRCAWPCRPAFCGIMTRMDVVGLAPSKPREYHSRKA